MHGNEHAQPIIRRGMPIWRCTHCGTTSAFEWIEVKDRRCRQPSCAGHYYDPQGGDWQRCRTCGGTGHSISAGRCEPCNGSGWLFDRKGTISPDLPAELWRLLDGGLWHATTASGLAGILSDGHIRLMEATRWPGSLCRQKGWVSLYDFGPTAFDREGFNFWDGWFGSRRTGRCTIWLKIDRGAAVEKLMDPPSVRAAFWQECEERKLAGDHKLYGEPWGQFIPFVEAGHRGPIPTSAIVGALVIDQHDWVRFTYHKGLTGLIEATEVFERGLPPPPPKSDLELIAEMASRRGGPTHEEALREMRSEGLIV